MLCSSSTQHHPLINQAGDSARQSTYIPTIPEDFSSKWMEYDERTATTVRSTLKQTFTCVTITKSNILNNRKSPFRMLHSDTALSSIIIYFLILAHGRMGWKRVPVALLYTGLLLCWAKEAALSAALPHLVNIHQMAFFRRNGFNPILSLTEWGNSFVKKVPQWWNNPLQPQQ